MRHHDIGFITGGVINYSIEACLFKKKYWLGDSVGRQQDDYVLMTVATAVEHLSGGEPFTVLRRTMYGYLEVQEAAAVSTKAYAEAL